ncbi:hypothetical protein D1872_319360 [compost metagenome]
MGVAARGHRLAECGRKTLDPLAVGLAAVFVHVLGVQVEGVKAPEFGGIQVMKRRGCAERMRPDFEQRIGLG